MSRRGRPNFQPNAEQREMATRMIALGIAHSKAAFVLGISAPTFAKHFRFEIETGECIRRVTSKSMAC